MSRPFRTITPSSTVAPDGRRQLPARGATVCLAVVSKRASAPSCIYQIPCPRSRDAADDRPFHHRQSPTRRRRSSRDVDAGRAAAVPRRPRRPRARRSPAGVWTSRWTGGRGGRGCARGGCAPGLADALRERMARTGVFTFDHLPYYAGLHDDDIRAGRAAYLECRVPGVPPGAAVTYTLSVTVGRDGGQPEDARDPQPDPARRRPALHPRRRAAHLQPGRVPGRRGVGAAPPAGGAAWTSSGSTSPTWRMGTRARRAGRAGGRDGRRPRRRAATRRVPLVDVAADSVSFAVPHDGDGTARRSPSVTAAGTPSPVDLAARVDVGTARVMFVNFAIQGLNDLFATPDDDYQPPRSYTQLTMRDEAASYSSRPGSEENSVGDGYAFTIDAHRRYGIPQMWAMNGGLATLLAHDCPDDVARHAPRRRGRPARAGRRRLRRPPPALLHGRDERRRHPVRRPGPGAGARRGPARLLPGPAADDLQGQRRGGAAVGGHGVRRRRRRHRAGRGARGGGGGRRATRRSRTRSRRWGRCTTGGG